MSDNPEMQFLSYLFAEMVLGIFPALPLAFIGGKIRDPIRHLFGLIDPEDHPD